MTKWLFFLALGVLLPLCSWGCMGVTKVNGYQVDTWHYRRSANAVRSRFAFDHSCPKEQVETILIHADAWTPIQIGARGCGKRAVYVKQRSGWTPEPK